MLETLDLTRKLGRAAYVREMTRRQIQLRTYFIQAADTENFRKRPTRDLDPLIDDDGVQLVGQLPSLAVTVTVRDFPSQFDFASGSSFDDLNINSPLLRKVVHGQPGQYRFRSNEVEPAGLC